MLPHTLAVRHQQGHQLITYSTIRSTNDPQQSTRSLLLYLRDLFPLRFTIWCVSFQVPGCLRRRLQVPEADADGALNASRTRLHKIIAICAEWIPQPSIHQGRFGSSSWKMENSTLRYMPHSKYLQSTHPMRFRMPPVYGKQFHTLGKVKRRLKLSTLVENQSRY